MRFAGTLLVGTAWMVGLGSGGRAEEGSGKDGSLVQYQTDLSCAAVTDIWALQMPADLPKEQQNDAWAAAIFFAAHAQVSGRQFGYAPSKIAGSIVVFQQMGLPEVRATDPATADQTKAHLAAAVQHCRDLPVFKNRPAHFADPDAK